MRTKVFYGFEERTGALLKSKGCLAAVGHRIVRVEQGDEPSVDPDISSIVEHLECARADMPVGMI